MEVKTSKNLLGFKIVSRAVNTTNMKFKVLIYCSA